MSVIRWEDPPPSTGRGRAASTFDSYAVAAALRMRPGIWAVVAESPLNAGLATAIGGAQLGAFAPAGSFAAVCRTVAGIRVIYARFLPGTVRRG